MGANVEQLVRELVVSADEEPDESEAERESDERRQAPCVPLASPRWVTVRREDLHRLRRR